MIVDFNIEKKGNIEGCDLKLSLLSFSYVHNLKMREWFSKQFHIIYV